MKVMKELRRAIKEYWNQRAHEYDDVPGHGLHSDTEKKAWMTLLNQAIGTTENLRVLDAGTGTGVIASLLAEMGHFVIGVDLSENMLSKAKSKVKKTGNSNPSVEFGNCVVENLPFKDNSVDVVVSRHLLWALPEPKKALKEWVRVLRQGGKVIIIDGNWFYNDTALYSRIRRFFANLLTLISERRNPWRMDNLSKMKGELPLIRRKRPDADIMMLKELGLEEVEVMPEIEKMTQTWFYRLKHGHWGKSFIVIGSKGSSLTQLSRK